MANLCSHKLGVSKYLIFKSTCKTKARQLLLWEWLAKCRSSFDSFSCGQCWLHMPMTFVSSLYLSNLYALYGHYPSIVEGLYLTSSVSDQLAVDHHGCATTTIAILKQFYILRPCIVCTDQNLETYLLTDLHWHTSWLRSCNNRKQLQQQESTKSRRRTRFRLGKSFY